MTIQLHKASWELLAQLDLDPTKLATIVPPGQLSAYIAAIYWLTDYIEEENPATQAQIEGFLQACHHLCAVSAWETVWKVLNTPFADSTEVTLATHLSAYRLGYEQIVLYSKLCGNLEPFANALCLRGLGEGYYNIDQGEPGQIYLQAALGAFEELNASAQIGWTLHHLGVNALYYFDNRQEAQTCFERAITLFRELGDYKGLAYTLHNLAAILNQQGRYAEARAFFEESLTLLYQQLPAADSAEKAWAHLTYSTFLMGQGELSIAQQQIRRSVRIFKFLENRSGLNWSLIHLASLLVQRQCSGSAQVVLQRLATEYCKLDEIAHDSAIVHHIIGWHELQQQAYARALRSFQASLTVSQKLNYLIGMANALEGGAFIALDTQQYDLSVRLHGAVATVRQTANVVTSPFEQERNQNALVRLRRLLGESSFQLAWCVGQAMSDDEAFALVMTMG